MLHHPSYFQNILLPKSHPLKQSRQPQSPPNSTTRIKTQPIILALSDGASIEINLKITIPRPHSKYPNERSRVETPLVNPPSQYGPSRQFKNKDQSLAGIKEEASQSQNISSQLLLSTPIKHGEGEKEGGVGSTTHKNLYGLKKTESLSFHEPLRRIQPEHRYPESLFRRRSSQYSKPRSIDPPPRNSLHNSKAGSIINMHLLDIKSQSEHSAHPQNLHLRGRRKGISLMRTNREMIGIE